MLLMIDNYDSFTFTLVQYFQALGEEVVVKRNDDITVNDIRRLNPERLVISPGPCSPNEAGLSVEIVKQFFQAKPILGVCLGHQAIAQAFGGKVIRADKVMHGKTSDIEHTGTGLFYGLPSPLRVTRYHSLIVAAQSVPDAFEITAWTAKEDGQQSEIMAMQHRDYPVAGVQFHPESVLTQSGARLLQNFLAY